MKKEIPDKYIQWLIKEIRKSYIGLETDSILGSHGGQKLQTKTKEEI